MTQDTALSAFVDGRSLPEDEARAIWKEFSEHMDEHRGDMSGFAAKRGWTSVAPEYREGQAVLVVRTTPSAPGLPPAPAPPKAAAPSTGAKKRPTRRPAAGGRASGGPAKKGSGPKRATPAKKGSGRPKG